MPKKFDQEAKDRVVRLLEERILAEKPVNATSVPGSRTKTGYLLAHSQAMDAVGSA